MDQSIILLTYKGKVLLLHKEHIQSSVVEDPWHFIFGVKAKSESFEETIHREVKREASINLTTIEFLGSVIDRDTKKYFYHTRLTDQNVNDIVRLEGNILAFFSPKELDTLLLSISTKLFIARHKNLLGKTTTNPS